MGDKGRAISLALVMVLSVIVGGLAFVGGASAQQSANIVVDDDGSGDYTEIQAAVENASDGDTIKVEPGTYNEPVVVDVPNLTIQGPEDGEAVLDVEGAGFAVDLASNLSVVTVADLTVKNWTIGGIGQGMSASEGTTPHFLDNRILVTDHAVAHGNSIQVTGDEAVVRGNYVEVTSYNSPDPNWATSGILVEGVDDALIADNQVVYAGNDQTDGEFYYRGITVEGTSEGWSGPAEDNVVRNNTVVGLSTGISVQMNASNTEIIGNTVRDNVVGIAVRKYQTRGHNNLVFDEAPSDIEIHESNILGNKVGVRNTLDGETVDARNNYWGAANGPEREAGNSGRLVGDGNPVEGDVVFKPWHGHMFGKTPVKKGHS